MWKTDPAPCPGYCALGECHMPVSCDESGPELGTCGQSENCCQSLLVPGGEFKRDYDGLDYQNQRHSATISPFLLDRFEVTVGRLRRFADAYANVLPSLVEGAGKSRYIEGDPGWQTSYPLPADRAALEQMLGCSGGTWTANDQSLPATCVDFHVAYAFCVWDGGRLPTEAEWSFAAAGGDEQRTYAWRVPLSGAPITEQHAQYYVDESSTAARVGTKPLGDGRWGHADLVGNVYEWALDYYAAYPSNCADCANLVPSQNRVVRSSSFLTVVDVTPVAERPAGYKPSAIRSVVGFRCARELPQGDWSP
jgi:formylglycine-generating enzyme required for sulfatase activity